MALVKSLDTRYGITSEYHKIVSMDVNWLYKTMKLQIASYINQQARIDGKSPLVEHTQYYSGDDFTYQPGSNLLAESYGKLKELDNWSGSLDV